MIRRCTSYPALPFTAWAAGVAVCFLGIGLEGAMSPLVPQAPVMMVATASEEEIMLVEEFDPPPALLTTDNSEPPPEEAEAEEEELDIPPLPEIAAPLTVPEVAEILPLAPRIEPPKPTIEPKPTPAPAPKPKLTAAAPVAKRASPGTSTTGSPAPVSGTGRSTAQLLRSPKPFYPSSEQRAKHHGTVRLLVVVESSGVPSTVSIATSSGFPALDEAASDTVQRRWRWASGTALRTYVPITFALR